MGQNLGLAHPKLLAAPRPTSCAAVLAFSAWLWRSSCPRRFSYQERIAGSGCKHHGKWMLLDYLIGNTDLPCPNTQKQRICSLEESSNRLSPNLLDALLQLFDLILQLLDLHQFIANPSLAGIYHLHSRPSQRAIKGHCMLGSAIALRTSLRGVHKSWDAIMSMWNCFSPDQIWCHDHYQWHIHRIAMPCPHALSPFAPCPSSWSENCFASHPPPALWPSNKLLFLWGEAKGEMSVSQQIIIKRVEVLTSCISFQNPITIPSAEAKQTPKGRKVNSCEFRVGFDQLPSFQIFSRGYAFVRL